MGLVRLGCRYFVESFMFFQVACAVEKAYVRRVQLGVLILPLESGSEVRYFILWVSSFTSYFFSCHGIDDGYYRWVSSAPPMGVVNLVAMLVNPGHGQG